MSTIVATYLSQKPQKSALAITMASIAAMGIITVIAWRNPEIRERLIASGDLVIGKGESYRLLFSMFMHSDPRHFLSNVYMFGILGFLICGYFGTGTYLFSFLGLGTLVHFISILTYPPETHLLGVSGVVYLFAGFWLVMFIGLDRRHKMASRIVRAVGVGLVILFPTSFEPQVSYRAHAIGFLIGVLFGIFYFLFKKSYFRRFEIIKPDEEESDIPPHLWN